MKLTDHILSLMLKHLSNTSSDAEANELRNWLEADDRHPAELAKIARIWKVSEAVNTQRPDVEAQWELFRSKHFTHTSAAAKPLNKVYTAKQNWLKYAAALLLFIGLGSVAFWLQGSTRYRTTEGERLRISLADGSSITLVNNTELSVPRTFNWFNRSLSLDGEALFKVAKNPEKPFHIEGPVTNTRVLGTAFRLCASTTKNFIEVSEGKVAYWLPATSDSIVLIKGESASATAGKLTKKRTETANANAWINGNFTFHKTPLREVLAILQDHYTFSLNAPKNLNGFACDFTGSFNAQPRDEVMQDLALAMDIHYHWKQNILIIEDINCTPQ